MFHPDDKKIFIHIPKTGGSSVEARLLENRGYTFSDKNIWGNLSDEDKKQLLGDKYRDMVYAPHAKAAELKNMYPDVYENYTSVSLVRNPYDRFCSIFYWHKRTSSTNEPKTAFKRLINNNELMVEPQHLYVCDNDTIIVDKIFKFEDIQEIFNFFNVKPAHLKKSKRLSTKKFYSIYPEMKSIIREYYAKDFELFNYEK